MPERNCLTAVTDQTSGGMSPSGIGRLGAMAKSTLAVLITRRKHHFPRPVVRASNRMP